MKLGLVVVAAALILAACGTPQSDEAGTAAAAEPSAPVAAPDVSADPSQAPVPPTTLGPMSGDLEGLLERPEPADRSVWRNQQPADYSITIERHNLNGMGGTRGDGTYVVSVEDGAIGACSMIDPWNGIDTCDMMGANPIETLFDWLDGYSERFRIVEFDPEWGFPTFIRFDFPPTADEEYEITVLEFVPG